MSTKRWCWATTGLLLAACHTIVEELPNGAPPNPLSGIVVTAPTVVPTPVPVPVPGPVSAPAPTTPSTPPTSATPPPSTTPPSQPVSGASCRLPAGTGSGVDCPRRTPSFSDELESSITALQHSQPNIFSGDGSRVLDQSRYISGLISELGRRGLCSHFDGEEMAIKNTNDFSDQYSVVSSSGFVRRGDNVYRATCFPAWF